MSAPSAVVSCRHPLREFAVQRYNFFFEPANISYFSYLNILITTKKISTNHCAITPPSNDLRVNLGTISNQSRTIYESTTHPTATYIYSVYIP